MMRSFKYEKFTDLDNALASLRSGGSAKILAGGTDLLLKIKHGMFGSQKVLDISGIENLNYIKEDNGFVKIGACSRLSFIEKNANIQKNAEFLSEVIAEIGPPEIRNVGTIGGNICAAGANCGVCFLPGCRGMTGDRSVLPCQNAAYADSLLPLVAFDAFVTLKTVDNERVVLVSDLQKDNGRLDLKPDEILTEIAFETRNASGWKYERFRHPESMGLPLVCVAVSKRGEKFNLVIGGSTKRLYRFADLSPEEIISISERVAFCSCLKFSENFRKKILKLMIGDSIMKANGGRN